MATLGVPTQFTVVRDGAAVLFPRTRAGDDPVSCLWALDLSWLEQAELAPLRNRFVPEGPGGHSLILARVA